MFFNEAFPRGYFCLKTLEKEFIYGCCRGCENEKERERIQEGFHSQARVERDFGNILPGAVRLEFAAVGVCHRCGRGLEKIKAGNLEMYRTVGGDPYAGRRNSADAENVYVKRSTEVMALVSDLIGMKRDDVEARQKWREQGVQFFGAPAAIFLFVDRFLPDMIPLIDIGIVIQTICLVALNYGLGTCIQGQGVMYPKIVAEHAGIPRSKRILMSIAIGYPDWDFPANAIVTPREPLDSIATWKGFE